MMEQAAELNKRSIPVVIACVSGVFFGPGPMLVAGIGLLLTSVSNEMGWSRTMFSAVPMIAAWAAAVSAPFFGRAMDQFGVRNVMLPSTLLFGLSFLGIAIFSTKTWHFFAAYLLIGLAAGAQGPVGYNKIISQWFSKYRGRVMALVAAVGSGLGYAIMPPIYNYVITHYGWRAGYYMVASGIVVICFTLSALFLRERGKPASAAQPAAGEAAAPVLKGIERAQALRSAPFWQLALTLFLACNAFYGVLVHMFPLLLDRGVDRGLAAGALSLVAVGAIIGQISAGFLLDRINTPKVSVLFFLTGLTGVVIIHFAAASKLVLLGAVCLGVGQGAELSVIAYLVTRIFGLRSFGALYGLIYAGANAASGTGPLLMGIAYDRTGSYDLMLFIFEGFLLISAASLALLPAYRFTAANADTAPAKAPPEAEPEAAALGTT